MTLKNYFLCNFLCSKTNNKYVFQYLMDTVGTKNILSFFLYRLCKNAFVLRGTNIGGFSLCWQKVLYSYFCKFTYTSS
jgi:hypothetical protein